MNIPNKYYIAYGSNLNHKQMSQRCPDALFVGKGYLKGCELVFRGNDQNAVATIESKENSRVPVGVWKISQHDERYLDIYEGYPRLYRKEFVPIESHQRKVNAMVYIMNDGYELALPSKIYFDTICQGYQDCGLDMTYLKQAVSKIEKMQIDRDKEFEQDYPIGYRDLRE